jgi:outer membrane protein OmpA-like peptidoglycan-associated protein
MKSIRLISLLCLLSLLLVCCKSRKHTVAVAPAVTGTEQVSDDPLKQIRESVSDSQVDQVTDGIKITIGSELLFATNSSVLTKSAILSLQKLAKSIRENKGDFDILIDGHTDATGTSSYNLWLSQRRATSVKVCLEAAGIGSSTMKITGYGDMNPVADNTTLNGRAKNRRVEITLIEKKAIQNDTSKGM